MNGKTTLGLVLGLGTALYTSSTSSYRGMESLQKRTEIETPTCDSPLELTIEEETAKLNENYDYNLTPGDLVFITRVVSMEAGSDPKAKTKEDLEKGWIGVIRVILNRYLFDKNHGTHLFGRDHSLGTIVKTHMQFHPVSFFPDLFQEKTFYDKEGDAQLGYGRITTKRAENIYSTVVSVLEQKEEDITDGALYFHADYAENGRRNETTAFHIGKEACKTRFTRQINTHRFFGTTCPINPYEEDF